jgi:predicted ATPase
MHDAFLRSVVLRRAEVEDFDRYPYSIPAINGLAIAIAADLTRTAGVAT